MIQKKYVQLIFTWIYGLFLGGYQYSLKIYVFQKVSTIIIIIIIIIIIVLFILQPMGRQYLPPKGPLYVSLCHKLVR